MIGEIRRSWAVVAPRYRRRLRLVAAYSLVISSLDTLALLLLFQLVGVLLDRPAGGIAGSLLPSVPHSEHGRVHASLVLLGMTAGLFVVRSLLSVLGLWLAAGAANAAQADLVARLLTGYARAPHLVRIERNTSETLRTILVSVDQVTTGMVFSSVSLVSDGGIVLAVVIALVLSSPLVALTTVVFFIVLSLLWLRNVRGTLIRRGHRIQDFAERRMRVLLQGIEAAKELQLRGRALFYADEAISHTGEINATYRGVLVINGSLRYLLETALVVGAFLVVLVAGATGGSRGALPAVGLLLGAAFRLLPALNRVLYLVNLLQFSRPALAIVEEEVATFGQITAPVPDESEAVAAIEFERELRLTDVTFRYPTRQVPALRDVSLTVRAGESIGIVGPTGSGKSTLIDIMLGLLEPDDGAIAVDGTPLHTVRDRWQRSIGYVPQDVYLVDDTVRANVALGWRGADIDETRVREAIHLAELDDVIDALPEGLDTIVGERGVRLSGGQQQRLGLARALYVRPTVLILDEATSNLDSSTEERIVDMIARLREPLTRIVVTHRVSTVRNCDCIVYLENGVVRAHGPFAEVVSAIPEFGEGRSPLEPSPLGLGQAANPLPS